MSRSPRSEGPKLVEEESKEDQIAILTAHEAILPSTSFNSEAQSFEYPDRLIIVGERTGMDSMKSKFSESGFDENGRCLRGISVPPMRVRYPVSDVSIPVIEQNMIEAASADELAGFSQEDRQVVHRPVLASLRASTDKFPCVANRVPGR